MRVLVLMNPEAGSVAQTPDPARAIQDAFAAHHVDAQVRAPRATELQHAASKALGENWDAIVACGGDGTLRTVAAVLVDQPATMGVLPLGTLNHFAKDLGIPLSLRDAAQLIAQGASQKIDVGEVNGNIFLNSSAIGIYPQMVSDREQYRLRLNLSKWPAMFIAALASLRRFPTLHLRLSVNGHEHQRTTPFVFVGNNQYEMNLFSVGTRSCLSSGTLSLYMGNRTGRFGMVRMVLRSLLGTLSQARDFESLCLKEAWIDTHRSHVSVALDGEVLTMTPPLHYRVRPGSLTVIAPPQREQATNAND